jgi:MFS family permease
MVVMRFFAGPIVHALTPLGLLALSAALAIGGLYTLSFTAGTTIFVAATLYGFGKTFFWPTMLGVVSEQMPRGGALTLNAISGIGMLAVGTLGFPFIGALQADKENAAVATSQVAASVPGIVEGGKLQVVEDKTIYEVISYKTISEKKLEEVLQTVPEPRRDDVKTEITKVRGRSKQGALADMAFFPAFMLVGYIILIFYFQARGGYKAVDIGGGSSGHH